jgi:hypothetical protein
MTKTRRPPKRTRATVRTNVNVRRGAKGPLVHEENKDESIPVPVIPGDNEVGTGYELKYWASDVNHGMTVGCTSFVKLACAPDQLDKANDVASELAYEYAHKNADRVRRDLTKFIDGGS